jgi:hypothetical protein
LPVAARGGGLRRISPARLRRFSPKFSKKSFFGPKSSYNFRQMGVVYCPRCQGNVAQAAGQTYCPRCGWNRLVAAHQIRSLQRLLPVLLLPFVAFAMLMVARTDQWETFLAVVILGLLLFYFSSRSLRRSQARLEGIKPVLEPAKMPEAFSLDVDEAGRQTKELLAMARPRPVRLTASGKVLFGFIVGLVALLELILLWHLLPAFTTAAPGEGLTSGEWTLLAGVLFCLLVLAAVPYYLSRQKNLVMNGEIALGKVLRQWRVRGNSFISYELETQGISVRREAVDCTHRLYKEMVVPVFYDPAKPSRQIACCAAYYEVILPNPE